jgi:DNA-binding SARP family transcriptional activator/tetratricopeptide (TPR) repeat protein
MVRLQTLGELRLGGEGSPSLSSRRKELVLLTYLARRSPRPLSRAQAAALLWEDRDERRSRQSLRQAVLELRRVVGEALRSDADHVWLESHAVELDVALFEREVDAGKLEEAVARWQDDFLIGAEEITGEELRTWLEAERESLRRRLRTALAGLIARSQERGAWREGIGWAERWLTALPLDQQAHLHLLKLLHLDGRTGEALARDAAFRVQLEAAGLPVTPELAQLSQTLGRVENTAQRPRATSAVLLSPDLVGRGSALAELDAAWADTLRGNGSVVIVEAELGIGKTRLCEEFARGLVARFERVGVYAAQPRQDPGPEEFAVVRRLAGALAGAAGLPGAPAAALAVLARIVPAIRERFPALTVVEASSESVAEAFQECVAAVAEESPVLLLVDDLLQADPASRNVLLALSQHVPAKCMLLCTARTGPDEPQLTLPSSTRIRRLKLQPLSPSEVELLLASMLELPPDERHQLGTRLHQQGGGNPFYTVELVSALADEGALLPTERGAWRLSASGDRLPLPTSIRDVIARRVARLSPPARNALEAAAILALPFDRELLAEVAGESPVSVETGLEELMLHRLIRETEPSGRYRFAHELVRRHVYQTVPVARGETISRRAVAALERRAAEDPSAIAALAQHRARLRAPWSARRRRTRIAIAATLAIGALATAALMGRKAASVPPASTIAVLPFSVSGSPDLGYLREGMVTLLSTQLEGVGTSRSADPRAVLGIAAQMAAGSPGGGNTGGGDPAAQVARRVSAGTYVRGSIIEVGGRVVIEATAYRTEGSAQPIARASVEGPTADLFELVDRLAGRLLSAINAGPFEQLTRIAVTTTSSLPALKAYLEGERHFRGGRFEEAERAFRHATAEDSTFALAFYWLSLAAWWTDDAATLDQAAATAVRLSGRLRPQDRRILDGWQAFLLGDVTGAERIYREIVRDEPEHVEAWLQLGELLFHAGPRRGRAEAEARPAFERVLEFEPEHISAILHLARIAAADGRKSDLDSLTRRALSIGATGEWATEARLHLALASGNAAALDSVVASLRTQPEGRAWNGAHYIALAHGDIAGARRLVAILTDAARASRVRAFGDIGLAYLALAEGRLRTAAEELGRAGALDPAMALEYRGIVALLPFVPVVPGSLAGLRDSVSRLPTIRRPLPPGENPWPTAHEGIQQDIALYLSARLALRAGDVMAARRGLEQLAARASPLPPQAVVHDLAASLRAALAVSANRPADALRELEQVQAIDPRADQVGSSPYYSQGLERFAYAMLLEASGRAEDAAVWYGSFSASSIFDLVFLAPSYLRRGAIAEGFGRPDEARRHYERAVALWSDCDPELRPFVDTARTRLAALRNEAAR